jgi:hypothetical protein
VGGVGGGDIEVGAGERGSVRVADPGDVERAEGLLVRMVEVSEGLVVSQLEGVHARCSRMVVRAGGEVDRGKVLGMLEEVVAELEQQQQQQQQDQQR